MGSIVVHERGEIGSYIYHVKSDIEGKYLFGGLSLAIRDGLQIVFVSNIGLYKEYEPLIEVDSIAKLLRLVGDLAMKPEIGDC